METSRETFKDATVDTKLNILFDVSERQEKLLEGIHVCLKGNGGVGLITLVAILKSRVTWLTALCFAVLGFVKFG